jgi:hypothetical protein
MKLSDARVSRLSHLIVEGLRSDKLADFANESLALKETKRVLAEFFSWEERLDEVVRRKIQSLSRPVPPGSREWDVLYRKYFEEEAKKQKIPL